MELIESLKIHSLYLSSFLMCKLYNITTPFQLNINDMFRDEIFQYWIDNCKLSENIRFQHNNFDNNNFSFKFNDS